MRWCPIVMILATLMVGSQFPVLGEELDTLTLHFEQQTRTGGPMSVTQGTLHYEASHRSVVQVTQPLPQMMVAEGHTLLLYYPDQARAFRFHAQRRFPLPVLDTILLSTQTDAGLSAHGYVLLKHEQRVGVTLTHWQPPESLKDQLGVAILGVDGDQIVSLEHRSPDGALRIRFTFRDHLALGSWSIPMRVDAVVHDPVTGFRQERVSYSDAQINQPLPDWARHFVLPDGVDVKEVRW